MHARPRLGIIVGVVLAVALLHAGCGARPRQASAPAVARHVLFITIDTLRADRIGAYGSVDVATPNIDRLAREGAMAPEMTAHVPLTRPSHVTIFTGLYPAQHGVRDNISPPLSADVPTLAEVFKGAGFRTAGFVSSIVLSRQSGLGRGFDDYSDQFDAGADDARFLETLQKRGDVTTRAAIDWLTAHAHDRTFTWVHLYDPHDPYDPPEPYASRYANRLYDGEVAWTDELVGRLDAALAQLGIRDDTLIVLTSDHGEGLGDHGEPVHGFFVYQSTLRVPLIVRGPGIAAGARVGVVARSVDLYPTVLDLIGIAPPPRAQPLAGRSLAPALRGETAKLDEQPSFAESLTPRIHYGWSDLRSVRDGRWKFILAPRPELYDLERDPGELTNVVGAAPAQARALRAGLERELAREQPITDQKNAAASVPPDVLERMGALGYVDAGGGPNRPTTGADPKDKVDEYRLLNRLLREGLVALREKRYAESAGHFRELGAHGVDSFEMHYYYGRALAGLTRWHDAATQFALAIPRLPAFTASYLQLADCRAASGDLKGAIAALHDGEKAVPTDPRLYEHEGDTWRRLENVPEAIRAYQAELRYAERDPVVRVRLAQSYRDAGDLDRAERYYRDAIAIDSRDASYWNALGMVVGARGNLAEAERLFREAISRDPRESRYTYNLALTLEREGNRADAAAYYQKTLALNAGFADARERLRELGRR